jgi:hypothetical protein
MFKSVPEGVAFFLAQGLTGSAFILVLCPVIILILRLCKNRPFWYFTKMDGSQCLEDGSIFFSVSVFSYAELEDATKTIDPSQELGGGGFGTVYYGENLTCLMQHETVKVRSKYKKISM